MDERFHAFLHRSARWRNKFVIIDLDCARRHLVQALISGAVSIHDGHKSIVAHLVDNAERLPEFLNTAEIPVITITVLANGDVEFDLDKISAKIHNFEIRGIAKDSHRYLGR